jgi:uncharacterized membrane protein YraQ (UPF0718 family)
VEAVIDGLWAGLHTTIEFFWDSLFGLLFGFLISAAAQVVVGRRAMRTVLGPGLRGVASGAALGIIASACSYGAAAAARGFFRRGADLRAIFAFLISSTNMNVAIVILFWTLLGWKFAFAEFFGGIIIIAVVACGLTLFAGAAGATTVEADDGEHVHCAHHGDDDEPAAGTSLRRPETWRRILQTALGDAAMLRNELIIGFVVAGFAAALVPPAWLAAALHAVGAVPFVGYPLLLLVGLGLAVVTFVCSMGNVPIARFLAMAGIPLGANTTFIYGDLLVPPMIAIYRKSFPPRVVWVFVLSFIVGALLAGATMDLLIGGVFGGVTMGSMTLNDRFTLISNLVAIVLVVALAVFAYRGRPEVADSPA